MQNSGSNVTHRIVTDLTQCFNPPFPQGYIRGYVGANKYFKNIPNEQRKNSKHYFETRERIKMHVTFDTSERRKHRSYQT
jgi:hypothetical protein